MAPTPTAEATRLTLPERASPTANTPGKLVSNIWGARVSGHGLLPCGPAVSIAPRKYEPLVIQGSHPRSHPVRGAPTVIKKRCSRSRAEISPEDIPTTQYAPKKFAFERNNLSIEMQLNVGIPSGAGSGIATSCSTIPLPAPTGLRRGQFATGTQQPARQFPPPTTAISWPSHHCDSRWTSQHSKFRYPQTSRDSPLWARCTVPRLR